MDLYLIRHADAVPVGKRGITEDADRPLSEEGAAQARALAAAFLRRGVSLDMVVTSPLLRARQTAEGLLSEWPQPAPGLYESPELALGGKRRKLTRFLRELSGPSIALVGHQPDLEEYAAWLIGGKKTRIDLAKAGVAHIVCPQEPGKGEGILVALLAPEWYGEAPVAAAKNKDKARSQ